MRYIKTVIAIFTILFFTLPFTAEADIFNAQIQKLDNGLEVIVIPNHRAPVVTHMVWYKVGAADEVEGKSGIAHFLEHLMFKGTEKFPDGTFSSTVKKLGGNDNAFTSQDYTAYYQDVSKDHLDKVMEMEADRMRNLILSEEDVRSERNVILEERRQRIDNSPQALFQEKLMHAIYPTHPYGTPVIGWENEMQQLSRQDALDTYKKWYAPNNAVLVISGDVTMNDVLPLAQKYYGALLPSENIPAVRTRAEPAALTQEQRVITEDNNVKQPMLRMVFRAPRGDKSLEAAIDILGGSSSSVLYKHLVMEQKKAISVSASYDPISFNASTVTINAIPTPDYKMADLEKDLKNEIASFAGADISNSELTASKNKMMAELIYYLDSLQGPAILFGRYITSGFDVNYIENINQKIDEINTTSASNAAKSVFIGTYPVVGYLLPKGGR